METRTETLASLYQDGLFDVPSYQRSYSWEESQLEDLIDDLQYLPEGATHFFGNVILDKRKEPYTTDRGRRFDIYDVVDGQQRLTTALILLHVATKYHKMVEATVSEDNLIFPIDERPRLMPQDQDQEFFRDSLFGESNLEAETPSQERLQNAYRFFESEFGDEQPKDTIKRISERLRYDFKINVVEIDGNSEAASIFESINDRGRSLSSLDKTKSFLMYMDDRSSNRGAKEEKINQRFGSIYRELFVLSNGHERVRDFDEDSVQRFHWGMYDGYDSDEYFNGLDTLKDRLRELYREGDYEAVQNEIDDYTKNLREAAAAFATLFHPSRQPQRVEIALERLLALGRLANVLPVLMAAQIRYGDDPEKVAKIVNACETLVFRMYAIDRRRSDTGRGKLVQLAHRIQSEASFTFEEAIGRLNSITQYYTNDSRFERKLRDPEFDTTRSRDIRYLLYHYGQNLDVDMQEDVQRDLQQILSNNFEVEHILARGLDESDVPESLRDEFEEYVHRLGNLTIASGYWNRSYGNLPFEEKKTAQGGREKEYRSSALRVQQVLADYDEFGKTELEEREQDIIEFALENWAAEPASSQVVRESGELEYESLPDNFAEVLTDRQEALIYILLDEDGWILNEEIRQRMEDEYGLATKGGTSMAGIVGGLTNRYSEEFTWAPLGLLDWRWADNQIEYRLNPGGRFEEELRERLK